MGLDVALVAPLRWRRRRRSPGRKWDEQNTQLPRTKEERTPPHQKESSWRQICVSSCFAFFGDLFIHSLFLSSVGRSAAMKFLNSSVTDCPPACLPVALRRATTTADRNCLRQTDNRRGQNCFCDKRQVHRCCSETMIIQVMFVIVGGGGGSLFHQLPRRREEWAKMK